MSSLSPMQLKDFVVRLLHVEANPDFHPHDGPGVGDKLDIDFETKQRKDGGQFRVDLDIKVNAPEARYKKCAYRIRAVLYVLFEFDKGTPASEIDKLLGLNGVAMAYSAARGIVAEASGTSLHGRYVLPTVNFVELAREKTKRAHKDNGTLRGRRKKQER